MKFGLFNLMPQRNLAKPARDVFHDAVEMVHLAEGAGFDTAWFAEHHFSNYCLCPSPLMMAAYCAGRTSRIRLGTGVVVVPLYSPARLLEEIALVDLLSNGRLALGLGSGYQEYEFQRFGAVVAESKQYFMEFLDVLEMAFRDGEYEYNGRHIRLPRTPIAIRPLQQPAPPIFVAGLYSDVEVQRRVVRNSWVPFATAGWRPARFLAQFKEKYIESAAGAGLDTAGLPFAVQRYVYVTSSRSAALSAAERIRYTGRIAQSTRFNYFQLDGSILRELPAKEEPGLEQIVENAIIGDVDTCIEKAIAEIGVLNPSHFSCFMQFGDMPLEESIRSLELFAGRVIPAVEKHFGGLDSIGHSKQPVAVAGS
jgi:alkanesulfonate monooxygenase SsuD/methylene tetrahydromethanopterin reductase-like flavin-dependent oxidoreductase (luciferase family)